jgi:hypothetical protein
VRLGQLLDATARAKQFVTRRTYAERDGRHASLVSHSEFEHAQEPAVPQSEYPLNVGKSAVPVEVPVTPMLTPEVLEDMDDEGGRVDKEDEGIDEFISV